LDVNAKMHEGEAGRRLWADCVRVVIDARKQLLASCHYIKPFIPAEIDGKPWESYPTEQIANDLRFFAFEPGQQWHNFEGYGAHQYFVDPCKFLLTTPGIDTATGKYSDFGIPATILANFLRDNGIVPEKCDLNSILFLMTPAEDEAKMQHLITQIARFERYVDEDAPLAEVLPSVYKNNEERYRGYTIRQLCQEMHDFYKSGNVKQLQKEMFRKAHFPRRALEPQQANYEFIRGNAELVSLENAAGRVAVEGALPYPPGVLCVVPGEVWGDSVLKYFLALEEGINRFPGFSPELQGVYIQTDPDGRKRAYGYVLTKAREAELCK
ncbi:MAG: ornithine decarboxylase, partial [Sutterella sp.]|nr:ornithine decarboxylase [Sutterella sp.]